MDEKSLPIKPGDWRERFGDDFSGDAEYLVSFEGGRETAAKATLTMANQYVITKRFDQYPDNIIGPYHKIAANFEKESLASGLFGPVQILQYRRKEKTK